MDIDCVNKLYVRTKEPVEAFKVALHDTVVSQYVLDLKNLRSQLGDVCLNEHLRPLFKFLYAIQRCLTSTFLTADPNRFEYGAVELSNLEKNLCIVDYIYKLILLVNILRSLIKVARGVVTFLLQSCSSFG
jgi:hypothetical protein